MAKYKNTDVKSLASQMRHEKAMGRPFAFLTGAGCSVSAKIPAVPELLKIINDHAHGVTVRHKLGCNDLCGQDYGEVMGHLTLDERKEIIEPILQNAKVNWGHIALAAMMKSGYVGRVLTFNFDSVLARSAGINGFYPATYDFGVSPADTFDHIVIPSILHLHGQGYGLTMLNSTEDTAIHAAKLLPLFRDTLQHSNLLVVGYSGRSDKAFEQLKAAYTNHKRLYWCNFMDAPADSHIESLLKKGKNTSTFLAGVKFDEFMVELAQELKCFPPVLFDDPPQYLLNEIEPIVDPGDEVPGAENLLPNLKSDMAKWKKWKKPSASRLLQDAMLRGDWKGAIALHQQVSSTEDFEKLAEAYFQQAKVKHQEARTLDDDLAVCVEAVELYRKAIELSPKHKDIMTNLGWALLDICTLEDAKEALKQFKAASAMDPNDYIALCGWGWALSELARQNEDLALNEEASIIFDAALKLNSDDALTIRGKGRVLARIYSFTKEDRLIPLVKNAISHAKRLDRHGNFSIACMFALIGDEESCRKELRQCRNDDTFPASRYANNNEDLRPYKEKLWLQQLLANSDSPQ